MAIIEARKVTKRFGGLTAVSQFDVEIKERSIHSIIGPNGAGKTTFFNCITGFYRHEEGTILSTARLSKGCCPTASHDSASPVPIRTSGFSTT